MIDEKTADQIPGAPALPPENQNLPAPAPARVLPKVTALPPAAALVVNGTKSEREIKLEAQLETETEKMRNAEIFAAEKELELEELRKIPPAPAPRKEKRWRMPQPLIGCDEEE